MSHSLPDFSSRNQNKQKKTNKRINLNEMIVSYIHLMYTDVNVHQLFNTKIKLTVSQIY